MAFCYGPVRPVLSQGWSLPRVSFVTGSVLNFMDRISRCSQAAEGVKSDGLWILSLLFAMTWSCWPSQTMSSLHWDSLQLVKWWE